MSHLLLAVDEDEERARAAAEGITELDWETASIAVSVLHVFTDNPEGASVSQLSAARRASEVLEAAGIEVELAETSGDPAEEILRFARSEDVDAIALAGRSRTPAGKAVFGSVSQSVLLDSEIPVLFCPAAVK